MGHKIAAGCLLVNLFVLHTTSFRVIFKVGKKRKGETPEEQRLRNKLHIQDWILAVSLLLQWHQWMKQPTLAKEQVKNIAPPSPIGGTMTGAAGAVPPLVPLGKEPTCKTPSEELAFMA